MECGRHAAEVGLAGEVEGPGLVRCPRNLLLLVYPTNFRLGDRCAVLVAGRTADEAALRRLRPLLEVLYSLPLNLEPSADRSPDGVPAEVLRALASRGLTRQEIQVLRLVGLGLTNKDIASRLFISENTVKTHVAHLLRKVGVSNRTGLAIFALDQGLGARENRDS
ncbi:MAG: response regulator transcription factor [Firmicutes bacterium]|nr:response regulator transcription factor [Bacillota bacterium]